MSIGSSLPNSMKKKIIDESEEFFADFFLNDKVKRVNGGYEFDFTG